jgi:hypothetical protein
LHFEVAAGAKFGRQLQALWECKPLGNESVDVIAGMEEGEEGRREPLPR